MILKLCAGTVIAAAILLILWLLERKGMLTLPELTPGAVTALAWGIAALCALAYALSWLIARRIYGRKEL